MTHTFKIAGVGRYLLACAVLFAASPLAHAGKDLLETPAFRAPKAAGAMLLDVVRAGSRVVAVGEHGIVLYSDTQGKTWQQADVPVSVTLTAAYFATPKKGWVVGHDGVILHSEDGGAHWSKQFDGNKANALVLAAMQKRAMQARPAEAQAAERALDDARAGAKFGPSRPLFGVWFRDESEGLVVGAFGQLFHTSDGGRSWTLWSERIDNPDNLHLNAISAAPGGALLIAGEAGKIFRSADGGASWAMLDTGYQGQLYGVLSMPGGQGVLIAFGFGGRVFRSTDHGAHWQQAALDEKKPLVSGLILPDGGLALLSYGGKIYRSADQGQNFTRDRNSAGLSVAAMARLDQGTFIVAGTSGARIVAGRQP